MGVAAPAVRHVEVFGIRHHGPGSARSLLAALDDYLPDSVLIEGPADAEPLIGLVSAAGMNPPVALFGYAADRPSLAAFWPYAVFSPEWQAMLWGAERGIPVSFCDLPASMTLAAAEQALDEPDPADDELDLDSGHRAPAAEVSRDPLAQLAAAAGYDDPERWWDDVIESRLDGASPFPALTEAMAELRADDTAYDHRRAMHEGRREAYMRQSIRAAWRSGRQRVAVVCGAWHAPALSPPLPPAAADARLLRGAPKRKVRFSWVPWTHERLTSASGYGAGITSPGWYHHLWTAPDQPVVRWLSMVAASLRTRDLPVSSAHVIEAVRLAENLAALRGRPLAGLSEVTEATRAVLCDGDELAVRFITDELVVGQRLGSVTPEAPTVPLEADLEAQCRTLRLKRTAEAKYVDLDLRKPNDQLRSRLFHRLRLLGLGWARPGQSEVQGRGTFRESWHLEWRPELAVDLVEAALWGTTVVAAAAAKVAAISRDGELGELTVAVERCLLADLPEALTGLLQALEAKAAVDADVLHLMEALPALVRAQRYGDVRDTDVGALADVCRALLLRICAGLPQAAVGLDDEAAATLRRRLDGVHAAVQLAAAADDPVAAEGRTRWLETLARLIERPDLNGVLVGRMVRILADAALLDDAPVRLHRALSHGVGAAAKAAWVDGFFSDGALLLIHDSALLELLDGWLQGLGPEEFVDVLPLVRRTFGSFGSAERRAIAGRIAAGAGRPEQPVDELDPALGEGVLATVARILGVRVGD
nr:DUF5682 family protein [Microlunatus panaciterrae]